MKIKHFGEVKQSIWTISACIHDNVKNVIPSNGKISTTPISSK